MSILTDIIGKLGNAAGGGILDGASKIISNFVEDPTKKTEALVEIEKLKAVHEEALAKMNTEVEQAYLKDMDSARNMQTAALAQTDLFSKRFIYYLASAVIVLVFAFDFCLFFVHYPNENRDMINFLSGILNSTALVMVLSFFFGSSMGSKKAGEQIDKMMLK